MAHGQHAPESFRNKFFEIETRLEDDRGNVLFTIERLEKWLQENALGIVRWCWTLHDLDTYTLDDCINRDDPTPRHAIVLASAEVWLDVDVRLRVWLYAELQAKRDPYAMRGYFGDFKPIHVHCAVEAKSARSFRQVAKELSISEGCIQKSTAHFRDKAMKGKQFEAMATYQTHKEDIQRSKGKYVYPDSAVHTSGFDYTELSTDYLELKARAAAGSMGRSEIDEVTNALFAGETTVRQVIDMYGYAFYHAHKKAFDDARQAFLASDAFTMPMRTNIYIGPDADFAKAHSDDLGGLGKTQLAKRIAMGLTPELTQHEAFHKVSDLKVAFDRYVEQPTIIFSESRPGGFMGILGRESTFNILEPHPDKDSVNIKFGDRVLVNRFNVIEGIVPWRRFLEGLAGEYVDKRGEHHEAEARTQAYRRFALVIGLTPTTFDLYGNKGVFMGDDTQLTSFMHLAHGEVNVARLMRTYGGEALCEVFKPVVDSVVDAVTKLIEMQNARKESTEDVISEDRPLLTFYEPGMGVEYDDAHPNGFIPAKVREQCREMVDGLSGYFSDIENLLDTSSGDEESLDAIRDAFDVLATELAKPWSLTDVYLLAVQRAIEYRRQEHAYEVEMGRKYPLLGISLPERPLWVQDDGFWSAIGGYADCLIGGERIDELAHAFERYRKLRHRYESLWPPPYVEVRFGPELTQGITVESLFPERY